MSTYNMLISRKKLEYIAHNLIMTTHAKERMLERLGDVDITRTILNSPFWFRNCEGYIIIGIDIQRYFVVEETERGFILVTVTDPSTNGYDIMDKFVLNYMERKE